MSWIQTYMGHKFDYNDVEHSTIDIKDIAHSLSQICRFSGMSKKFYSVAQHSLRVCESLKDCNKETQLYALLHDAAEAYISDVPRPLKENLEKYKEIENNIFFNIIHTFGINADRYCNVDTWIIKRLDNHWLACEATQLFNKGPIDNWISKYFDDTRKIEKLIFEDMKTVEKKFLKKYNELRII